MYVPAEIHRRLILGLGHLSPIPAPDGHRLAGFLDAEGSFGIRPNNGGRTWQCPVSVSVRDDDTRLLSELRDLTGLGKLYSLEASGRSRPQTLWTIASKLECRRLAQILDAYPLRGRKAADAAIWVEAVALWTALDRGLTPDAARELPLLAATLKRGRGYVEPKVQGQAGDYESLCPFLGGFFTGEGCLRLTARHARAVVKTRRDDRPLLEQFRATFGLGSVSNGAAYGRSAPTAQWYFGADRDILRVVDLFDECALLGRKRRQYAAWRPAAIEIGLAHRDGRPVDTRVTAEAQAKLAAASAYAPETIPGPAKPPDPREAYVELLRDWAANLPGPPTGMAYTRDRLAYWPDRNTLARAFGSWAAALAAAGLRPARRTASTGTNY